MVKYKDLTHEDKQSALDDSWEIMNEETDPERLERIGKDMNGVRDTIISLLEGLGAEFESKDILPNNDFDWLIKQAERAQELQSQLNEIKITKYKNGRPTVLDWNGERWVLDSQTTFKGGTKRGKG